MNESPQVPIIAVVDDDESVRESLAGLAETVGYEAALFASAEEFLRSVRLRDSLACLILDVRLPLWRRESTGLSTDVDCMFTHCRDNCGHGFILLETISARRFD